MSVIQRLVAAVVAIITGYNTLKDRNTALREQLTKEQAHSAALQAALDANGGLSDALKKSQADLAALQAQNKADNDAASGEVDAAETAVAAIHADDEIPVTVNPDGTAVATGDAAKPSDNAGAPATT